MINRKGKGSRWEREIIAALEANGYACTRAAGSMGVWDIIAFNVNGGKLIQAKCNGKGTKREREAMANFKCHANFSKEIWIKNDREPAPIIEWWDGQEWLMAMFAFDWQEKLHKMREEKRRK